MNASDKKSGTRTSVLTMCDLRQSGDAPPALLSAEVVNVNGVPVVFGGCSDDGANGVVFALNLETMSWTKIVTTGESPVGRIGHCFHRIQATGPSDPIRLVVHGGFATSVAGNTATNPLDKSSQLSFRGGLSNETYVLDVPVQAADGRVDLQGSSWKWTKVSVSGSRPPECAFFGSSMVGGSLYVHGGYASTDWSRPNNDLWVLRLNGYSGPWTKINLSGSSTDASHGLGFHKLLSIPDSTPLRFLAFGGVSAEGSNPTSDSSSSSSTAFLQWIVVDPNQSGARMENVKCDDSPTLLVESKANSSPTSANRGAGHKNRAAGSMPYPACLVGPRKGHTVLSLGSVAAKSSSPDESVFRFIVLGGELQASALGCESTSSNVYVFDVISKKEDSMLSESSSSAAPKIVWTRPLCESSGMTIRGHVAVCNRDKVIVFGGARISTAPGSDQQHAAGRMVLSKKLFFMSLVDLSSVGPAMESIADSTGKFKVVTVGDSGVGKSCVLARLTEDSYTDFHISTVGVDFLTLPVMVRGQLVRLQLWDTAGQERFNVVTGNYYRNADAFVVVFDFGSRASFDHIEAWVNQIKAHHPMGADTVAILLGNKSDLPPAKLAVTEAEAKTKASNMGALYYSVSAKTGLNVDCAFLNVASRLVDIRRAARAQGPKSLEGGPPISSGPSAASSVLSRSGLVSLTTDLSASLRRRKCCEF